MQRMARVFPDIDDPVDAVTAALGRAARVAAVVHGHAIGTGRAALVVLVSLLEGSQMGLVAIVIGSITPVNVPSI